MESKENVKEKIYAVRNAIKSRAINYNWHESIVSYMEAIFARGDRRMCDVLVTAFEKGAKFDGWGECFKPELWWDALSKAGLDTGFYANRLRSYEEILPWDHLDYAVTKSYLIEENKKAHAEATTPNCRLHCGGCGAAKYGEGVCFEKR